MLLAILPLILADTVEADIGAKRSISHSGLKPGFSRTCHEGLLSDKNLWSKYVGQICSV